MYSQIIEVLNFSFLNIRLANFFWKMLHVIDLRFATQFRTNVAQHRAIEKITKVDTNFAQVFSIFDFCEGCRAIKIRPAWKIFFSESFFLSFCFNCMYRFSFLDISFDILLFIRYFVVHKNVSRLICVIVLRYYSIL